MSAAGLACLAAGAVVAAAGILCFWAAVAPRPRVLLLRAMIRLTGTDEAPARAAALRALVPGGIESQLDVRYDPADRDALLDVFAPVGFRAPLAAIVWVHGGGWIGGTKNDMREYLQILAGRGYVTIGVEYSHAPRRRHPAPARQVGAALSYLDRHATELGIDNGRFPPTLISAGNGDPLARQSLLMAAALTSHQVPVQPLFFDGHEPPLPHEYHLDLPSTAAQLALQTITAHVNRYTACSPRESTGEPRG